MTKVLTDADALADLHGLPRPSDLIQRLRQYVAADGGDLADVKQAADELVRLTAERDALQAKVDALMLEHCPDEMTPKQVAEWGEWGEHTTAAGAVKTECSHGVPYRYACEACDDEARSKT